MIASIVIDGVLKLIQKRVSKNAAFKTEENVIRVYGPRSTVPEMILYESKQLPGTYLNEVTEDIWLEKNGKLSLLKV